MPASKPSSILSRRAVIAACVAGVAAVGALAAPSLRSGPLRPGSARSWWRGHSVVNLVRGGLHDWSRQVGTEFTLMGESGAVTVQLAEVAPLPSEGRETVRLARDHAFALHFAGRGAALPAGDRMYAIRSGSQAPMNVYFSPTADTMVAIFG